MSTVAEKWTIRVELIVFGALGFWLPDTLFHAFRRNDFNWHDVRIMSVLMPTTLLLTLLVIKWVRRANVERTSGLLLLVGVWFLGGLFMALGATFSGGGFASPGGFREVGFVLLLSLFPMYTFMMAAYDGSLLALLFVTVAMVVVWTIPQTRPLMQFGGQRAQL